MGKNFDKTPTIDNFKAPWESEDGEEVDLVKLKKYVHGLLVDKAKAQDERDDAKAKTKVVETERDELQSKVDSADGAETAKRISDLEKKVATESARADKAEAGLLRHEVAAEKKLSPTQAKYLTGEDREALEASADEILQDFGGAPAADDDDDDAGAHLSPRVDTKLVNPIDPKNGADMEPDYEKVAAQIQSNRIL